MKTYRWVRSIRRVILAGTVVAGCQAMTVMGQTNIWTNSASGYWEQPVWSAGALPGTNQTIQFTNAWQALAIGPSTVANYADTLRVGAVLLSAPSNSLNTLLLNYAGLENPLVIGDETSGGTNVFPGRLEVHTNSAVVILDSALQINNQAAAAFPPSGPELGGFSIGGSLNQGEFSTVTAGFVHIGDIGPGVYNLTNGLVSIAAQRLGGNYSACSLNGSSYIEHVDFMSDEISAGMIGKDQHFTVKIEGDTFTQTGVLSNGKRLSEIWKRIS